MKILVIRNDKLGDFMLAYPSFALAKMNLPDTEVHALVPGYTQPLANVCNWIDKVIIDPGKNAGLQKNIDLLNKLKQEKYDAVITLFSTTRIGMLTMLAGIPYRLAPATKIAQVFYNHRLVQRRSLSEKPEYIYNMDLVCYFLQSQGVNNIFNPVLPYLSFPETEISALRREFIQENNIPETHKLIFIHAGSGGSAVNLTPQQYAQLAENINSKNGHTIILTAGPGEINVANTVASYLSKTACIIYESKKGVLNFTKYISIADLFVSGSTGPLHIAGALDIPTAGFYPSRRSATPLRWQTLNSPNNRLAFCPGNSGIQEDMSSFDLKQIAKVISEHFNFI